jgi:hypothetical protein
VFNIKTMIYYYDFIKKKKKNEKTTTFSLIKTLHPDRVCLACTCTCIYDMVKCAKCTWSPV